MRNKVEILARFSRHGFLPAEYAVLSQTGFTPRPPSEVARHSIDSIYCFGLPLTLAECETAVASCLDKGWLFVVTESWLQGIESTLEAGQVIGPIRGLPLAGEIDVSKSGIEVLQRFHADEPERRSFDPPTLAYLERHPFIITETLELNESHRKERGYTFTRPNPEQVLAGYREMGQVVLSASDPVPIERWCITWRDDPSDGFMMDVEIANPQ